MENYKENVDFIFFHYASQMFSWLFIIIIFLTMKFIIT